MQRGGPVPNRGPENFPGLGIEHHSFDVQAMFHPTHLVPLDIACEDGVRMVFCR